MKASKTYARLFLRRAAMLAAAASFFVPSSHAQFGPSRPAVKSPELPGEGKITFRILAERAESVKLGSSDLPGLFRGADMKKGEQGIWEVTLGPVDPGSYRYEFSVDGMPVLDPTNPEISQSNSRAWSLVHVPGSDISDIKQVPHGAVAEVTYYSESLKRFRRMHVYTPPGYEAGAGKFPVLYLLHGASDSDASWSTVGRAGVILDNLIAEKKAKPMIVVMPHGHTGAFEFGSRSPLRMEEFVTDFVKDIRPLVEKTYRVQADRGSRAIAGLSMGGAQTLDIAIPHLDEFGYCGVFSSGVFGLTREGPSIPGSEGWEARNKKTLEDASLREGLKLAWFATGKEDFLLKTSQATVELLRKHGFDVVYVESGGGHTWINWRNYLHEFAQKLFQ